MRKPRLVSLLASVCLATGTAGGIGATQVVATGAAHPFIHEIVQGPALHKPPTTDDCVNVFYGFHCYQPAQLVEAYNLDKLHSHGIDGRGATILIVDSFGSPTLAHDLHVFDQTFGIPDPPSLEIRHDAGTLPPFDPNNSDMTGWAAETTLDVEWSHVFAPGAKIVVEATPVSETEGVQGFPQIVKAENYAIDHGLADVISQSFGATEPTFPSAQSILDLRGSFKNARKHHVTVLGASGDEGATDLLFDTSCCYDHRVNSWPSSDPLVTSVGGTQLHLRANGTRTSPDSVWNDPNSVIGGNPADPTTCCAGGGGVSAVFKRPRFQQDVANITGPMRGTPDISLSAALDGAVVYYHSYLPADADSAKGPWHIVAGTSEASPEFAGIVAMADQVAGKRLGNINNAMYGLGYGEGGLVDVTQGNNTLTFLDATNHLITVQGFNAKRGYDLASGLGTIDAARFVRALADNHADDGSQSQDDG
ncbi:MAG: S53 family peptidase [Candidatus Dormiibacterota bacterium]